NVDNQQLAALIAMQGYNYHKRYKGNEYDPYVFRGLYYALAKVKGTNYNALILPTAINKLFALAVSKQSSKFYASGNDGRVMEGDFLQMSSNPTPYKNEGYTNQALALSKDEKYLAVGNDSSVLELINLQSKEKPLLIRGHRGSITDIKCMPDNSGFISVSSGGTIHFTRQNEGKSYKVEALPFSFKAIDISSDSQWIAAATLEGKLILINTKDYTHREIANEAPNRILSVAFNPMRVNLLAYGMEVISQNKVVRGIVKMIDIETNKTKELSGHRAGIADLKFSPDGKLLASAGLDKKLQMWVVDHEEDLPIVMDNNNGNVWRIDFANGYDYLLGSCNNGEIRVW
ncbi:MAG: WD40 repeat domain-containing protein, partial [Flammeovirgaceae bacterium]